MARKVILACAGMSLLAHAMAVTLWSTSDHLAYSPQTTAAQAWQVRHITRATQHISASRSHSVDLAPTDAQLMDAQYASTERVPSEEATAPPAFDTPTASPAPVQDHDITTSETAPQPPVSATSGMSDYVPRPLLSVPPMAQAPVFIAPPSGAFEPQRVSGVLSLFINEFGVVDHISTQGSDLPPEFEEAALAAFRGARFTPGQLDGQAVKSRIKVEVVFDNTPLTPPPDEGPTH